MKQQCSSIRTSALTINAQLVSVYTGGHNLTARTHTEGVACSLLFLRSIIGEYFMGETIVSNRHLEEEERERKREKERNGEIKKADRKRIRE